MQILEIKLIGNYNCNRMSSTIRAPVLVDRLHQRQRNWAANVIYQISYLEVLSDSLKASNLIPVSFRAVANSQQSSAAEKACRFFPSATEDSSSTFHETSKRRLFPRHEKETMALRSHSRKSRGWSKRVDTRARARKEGKIAM